MPYIQKLLLEQIFTYLTQKQLFINISPASCGIVPFFCHTIEDCVRVYKPEKAIEAAVYNKVLTLLHDGLHLYRLSPVKVSRCLINKPQ